MSGLVWLASYPKSGSTWFRMLMSNLLTEGEQDADINEPEERTSITSSRLSFEDVTLLDSEMLTADEADILRPRVFEAIAAGDYANPATRPWEMRPDWPVLMKVHDAYTLTPQAEPLLAAAQSAILIVRDPRGVAPSFAHHVGCSIDRAIDLMAFEEAAFGELPHRPSPQIRQKLLSWSSHTASWLDQTDMPIHIVRYEDLKADTPGVFFEAMRFAGRGITRAEAERAARLAEFDRLQGQERANGFREWPSRRGAHTFFRRGEAEGWRQELSPDQIARIQTAQGPMMRRLSYAFESVADVLDKE